MQEKQSTTHTVGGKYFGLIFPLTTLPFMSCEKAELNLPRLWLEDYIPKI